MVAGQYMCTFGDFIAFLYRLVQFAVTTLTPIVVTGTVIYGAFLIMFYGLNPSNLVRGKAIILDAFVGLLIVWGAWAIVNTVFYLLGVHLPCGNAWYELTPTCRVPYE